MLMYPLALKGVFELGQQGPLGGDSYGRYVVNGED